MSTGAKSVLTEAQAMVTQAEEHGEWRRFSEANPVAARRLVERRSNLRVLEIGVSLGCEDEAVALQRAAQVRYHLARLLDIFESS